MNNKTLWITVISVTTFFLAMGIAGARSTGQEAAATVDDSINYQGRLTGANGSLLHGTHKMVFRIYGTASGGTALWSSGNMQVNVSRGLFNVTLDVNQNQFNGRELWLDITVNDEVLSPRQELLPAPYALSLRPGAIISGQPANANQAVLDVRMQGFWPNGRTISGFAPATGTAVRAEAAGGPGVYGSSDNT